jgi:hypothetical protein
MSGSRTTATAVFDTSNDTNSTINIYAQHPLNVAEARTRAKAIVGSVAAAPRKAPFGVSKAFANSNATKLAQQQRGAAPQFTNVLSSIRLSEGGGGAAAQVRIAVSMLGVSHFSRTLVVPDSITFAQLHDRVLMPAFGMPRRTPPVGFFFAPTAPAMALQDGVVLSGTDGDVTVAPYMHFPLAIGNARFLNNNDYALFGIKQLLLANKTTLRNAGLVVGHELAWVVAPSDNGYIFVVHVLDFLTGANRLAAPITLEAGTGGAVLFVPAHPYSSLLARFAVGHFPASAIYLSVVKALASTNDSLPVVVGGTDSLMGAQLESDELVQHGLFMPFVLGFWKRHLLLHIMCAYSTDPEDEFVDSRLPLALKGTRVPYVPTPSVCVNCRNAAQLMCAGCEIVWYCSPKCQSEHWPFHEKFCCQLVEVAATNPLVLEPKMQSGKVISYSIRHGMFWIQHGTQKPEPQRVDPTKLAKRPAAAKVTGKK